MSSATTTVGRPRPSSPVQTASASSPWPVIHTIATRQGAPDAAFACRGRPTRWASTTTRSASSGTFSMAAAAMAARAPAASIRWWSSTRSHADGSGPAVQVYAVTR